VNTQQHIVVIDTDTANEIDDQFALAWALLAHRGPNNKSWALDIRGIYATPFSFAHRKSFLTAAPIYADPSAPNFCSPQEGMERSFYEAKKVVDLLGLPLAPPILKGSCNYLKSSNQPEPSEAADHLIELVHSCRPEDNRIVVLALGCLTNIASALLKAPQIASRLKIVWTSGYPSYAPFVNRAFNLEQDLWATKVVYDSAADLVYLPGYHVGAQLRLSLAEMQQYVHNKSAIGNYLYELFTNNPLWPIVGRPASPAHSWVIWDIICVAWALEPSWLDMTTLPRPNIDTNLVWQPSDNNRTMLEAYGLKRDVIFNEMFASLADYTN
jgi:purine nucleosidase